MSAAPEYTGPGVSLHVTFHIDPAQLDAFFEALKPVYDAVIAEPECVFFEIYKDPNVPGKLRFVENWNQSLEWLVSNQIPKDYYKPYIEKTTPMWVKPREHEILERMPGKDWVMVKDAMPK